MKRSSKPRNPSSASTLSRSDDGGKSSSADKIRILIADDHTTVLAGLASIIGMQPDMIVVAEAVNGREAVDLWQKHRPDVTLLDLRMPKLDGVGVIDEIHKEDTSARIILLTTYDTDNEIYRAIKAGAKGYLLKDARREELLESIRKVSRGETCIPQALVEKLAAGMSSETLTGRELGVLTLLARGKSNKEIGANLFISETTVKGHLHNIFTKLNVLSRTEAITVASRRGLVQL
jgi:DNA-binding NarL/FixJ family response regulator